MEPKGALLDIATQLYKGEEFIVNGMEYSLVTVFQRCKQSYAYTQADKLLRAHEDGEKRLPLVTKESLIALQKAIFNRHALKLAREIERATRFQPMRIAA